MNNDKPINHFIPTERSRLRVMKRRAAYDRATVYGILDASLLCHIGYVIEGQPYVTPTAFWREDDHLYWHGSSASRALTTQSNGISVCFTVAHVDGLVLARSGFHHSINYRSVTAFGTAHLLEDPIAKTRAMDVFVDRFFPGRAAAVRRPKAKEIKATKIVGMKIEEATAKVRVGPPIDDEEDYALPIWAGVIEMSTRVGQTIRDDRVVAGVTKPKHIAAYRAGTSFGDLLCNISGTDQQSGSRRDRNPGSQRR